MKDQIAVRCFDSSVKRIYDLNINLTVESPAVFGSIIIPYIRHLIDALLVSPVVKMLRDSSEKYVMHFITLQRGSSAGNIGGLYLVLFQLQMVKRRY